MSRLAVRRALGFGVVAWSCSASREPPAAAPESASALTPSAVQTGGDGIDASIARAESVYLRAAFDTARAEFEGALRAARAAHDSLNEARVLTWLGLTAWRTGDFARARTLGEQALALKLRLGRRAEVARSFNALGLLAWNESRLGDATTLFSRAMEAAASDSDVATSGKASNNLGLVYIEQGKFAEAQRGFAEAQRAGQRLRDARLEGGALSNLGMLDVQLGDPASGVIALGRARTLYQSIAYGTGEQNTLAQLATAYEALGEPRLAFAAADTALEIARRQGLRVEEAANIELAAGLYRHAGDLPRALGLYNRAHALDREIGAPVDEGTNLRNAAEIEAALGRRNVALRLVSTALGIHAKAGAPLEELRDHLLIADLGSPGPTASDAESHLRAAQGLATALVARAARLEVAFARATIADRRGESRLVLRALGAVQADLARGGYGTEWRSASLRARAFLRLDMLDSALAAGRAAVAAVERTRGRYGSAFLRSTYAADKTDTYADLVNILLRLGKVDEAFEVADAGRSRALIENLGATRSDSAASATVRALAEGDGLIRRIDALVARLDTIEETPSAERDVATQATARELVSSIAETRGAYEALLVRVSERDARGATLLGGRGVRAVDVRSALRPDEALVEYVVTPKRLLTFVATRHRIGHVASDVSHDQLVRHTRLARDLVGRPRTVSEDSRDVLVALHDALIAPAQRAGLLDGVTRLVIVPHSVVSYLPFAALRRAENGRYLVADYALLQASSAGALATLRADRRSPATAGRLTAAGFASFPDALPASARELRAFRGAMPAATTYSGVSASEARLRQALSDADVVHVATHGEMNPGNPMFSRIELARGTNGWADDGRLEVHEVLGLRITAGLVFLSGCETGAGPAWSTQFVRGDDYASLGQAFLFAGARSVVSTLWPIADDGAAEFATRFYAHLASKAPPEALAAAQREMLASGGRVAPYYWAAYQVSGDGESVRRAHNAGGGP